MSARLTQYDVTSCIEKCGQDGGRGGGDSGYKSDGASGGDGGGGGGDGGGGGGNVYDVVNSRENNRLKQLLDILDDIEPTPPCEDEGWDLKYEKRTEYKKFMVPSPLKAKRRWGNTIGPCISAHCSGLDGASRLDCIVNMCNRSRRGTR